MKLAESAVLQCPCGKWVMRRAPTQVYCDGCAKQRAAARSLTHYHANKGKTVELSVAAKEARRRQYTDRRAFLKQRAAERSISTADQWEPERQVPLLWRVEVRVPFDKSWSKNAMLRSGKDGDVFLRTAHKDLRGKLGLIVAAEIAKRGVRVVHHKVWLDILVQKSSHKSDAINVLDGIADSLKVALGVDDNWFCVRRLDWEVVKRDPVVIIGIGQETDQHHRICSHCGRCLLLSAFPTRNGDPHHCKQRVCAECNRLPPLEL
jgi:hypothetical protein